MSSSPSQNPSPKSQQQWRFTWETLAHISTLRLYLFPTPSRPSLSISNLTASLNPPLLVVSFANENSEEVFVRVPVPKVLIDPESELEWAVKSDYVEIKLNLMLPVDHPVFADLGEDDSLNGDEGFLPLNQNDDLKELSSKDVDLYCKSCSAKLTKEPLRKFTQMPSENWREAAENWFGNCCCSFGASGEILINNYLKSFDLSQTSLLNFSSVIVNKDTLFHSSSDKQTLLFNPQNKYTHTNNIVTQCNDNTDHCCHGEKNAHEKTIISNDGNINNNIYLGGGFMISENNISKDVNWVEFCCYKCFAPIGAYPCNNNTNSNDFNMIDGGIRLFKCYISTSLPVGGPNDIFRRYKVQNLFSNLLLEMAEDEISFRTVVRDLKSRKPTLKIILLSSSKTWSFSDSCFANRADVNGSGREAELRPVMKVLFADCGDDDDDARLVESWKKKYGAEEVYMHMSQIEELKECLNFNLGNIPLSCASLQRMNVSWMEC
ncbi:hypothetical protein LUZ60_013546 [Juncus effusus]|nr:hypothetical protein LUZ60_013546 [Juncus effusus]